MYVECIHTHVIWKENLNGYRVMLWNNNMNRRDGCYSSHLNSKSLRKLKNTRNFEYLFFIADRLTINDNNVPRVMTFSSFSRIFK